MVVRVATVTAQALVVPVELAGLEGASLQSTLLREWRQKQLAAHPWLVLRVQGLTAGQAERTLSEYLYKV
jgi:hypothetical protein